MNKMNILGVTFLRGVNGYAKLHISNNKKIKNLARQTFSCIL